MQIKINCRTCKKEVFIKPSRIKTAKFCSRKCVRFSQKVKDKMSKDRRGVSKSESHRKSISLGKMAEKNPMWRGDDVGLDALHLWVTSRFPKPKLCKDCKKVPPYDLVNISQKYKRDLSDWEWLCRRCHMLKDGRLKNFNFNRNNRG